MPNYDLIVYHDFDSKVTVAPGDPATKLGSMFANDQFVSGVYPPLPGHVSKEATVVISGGKRPIAGLKTLLGG